MIFLSVPPKNLYETVGSPALGAEGHVLDFGCGLGIHCFSLAERFGCRVTGIDISEGNLKVAERTNLEKGLQELVSFKFANIENLPFEKGDFSMAWGRDVLLHISDLKKAFSECSRVLTDDGKVVLYTTFATPLISAFDIDYVCKPLNINPENLDSEYFENAFKEAGLSIVKSVELGAQWIEYNEENDRQASRYLIRLARMIRGRERFRPEIGELAYDLTLANYTWHVFLMIGKLSSVAYQLQRT